MTFRVITGETPQSGNPQNSATGKVKGLTVRPAPQSLRPRSQESVEIAPLIERLETLSFTFEALNAGSRTYAAEAVLETLARMERRDLQSLAAVEAFASALKTVGQHLAGLRHAVQNTAHDTAAAIEDIGARLAALETRGDGAQLPAPAQNGALTEISDRLGKIEGLLDGGDSRSDSELMTQLLHNMVRRVGDVESKIDSLPDRIAVPTVDLEPVNAQLDALGGQMARVEQKIDESRAKDIAIIRESIETIALRVSRIELGIDQTPGMKLSEPFDPAPILDVLQNINNRVKEMERRPQSGGADLNQLSGYLGAIDQRLERMETGIAPTEDGTPHPVAQAASPTSPPPARQSSEPQIQGRAEAVASTLSRILPRPAVAVAADEPAATEHAATAQAAAEQAATEQVASAPPQESVVQDVAAETAADAQPNVAPESSETVAAPEAAAQETKMNAAVETAAEPQIEAPAQTPPETPEDNRAKVDQLLEQVLRVLSR